MLRNQAAISPYAMSFINALLIGPETEIDHDKAHHLAWIYSNLIYDPTHVNGSRLPLGPQQREIVLAALKRKNMPQDKQHDLRQLLRLEQPWSLKALAQDGLYFLRKLWWG